jgi:hypothetical protein
MELMEKFNLKEMRISFSFSPQAPKILFTEMQPTSNYRAN